MCFEKFLENNTGRFVVINGRLMHINSYKEVSSHPTMYKVDYSCLIDLVALDIDFRISGFVEEVREEIEAGRFESEGDKKYGGHTVKAGYYALSVKDNQQLCEIFFATPTPTPRRGE